MSAEDRRVLITSEPLGIGMVLAKAFLDQGAKVAIDDRLPEVVTQSIAKIGQADPSV